MDHFDEWLKIVSTPRKMLLIDDNEADCELITSMSKDFNIDWVVANNGPEAFAVIQNSKRRINLIILDLKLGTPPDGVELFREIKKSIPATPILVLSGHIDTDTIAEITRMGFAMFAQKPTIYDVGFFDQLFLALNIPRKGPELDKNKQQGEEKV